MVIKDLSELLGFGFRPEEFQREAKIVTICRKGVRVRSDLLRMLTNIALTIPLRYWVVFGALTPGELREYHARKEEAEQSARSIMPE